MAITRAQQAKQLLANGGRIGYRGGADMGAVGVEKTKGGDYVKYKKDSKAAGSFRSAFKSNCAGKSASSTFEWQGRKYSCAKK